jgi:hypothetical protein
VPANKNRCKVLGLEKCRNRDEKNFPWHKKKLALVDRIGYSGPIAGNDRSAVNAGDDVEPDRLGID